MDENGRPSNKQKKRRKVRKQPVEIEGNIELVEDNPALEGSQDDDMQAVSEPEAGGSLQKSARKKRRSRRKPSDSKQRVNMQTPKTYITAVLEELGDDMVDEPLRLDIGDCSVVEPVQAPASLPADKVYVERKNGFATTPRIKMFQPINYPEEGLVDAEYSRSVGSPLELAILIQKCCRPLYTLCHGLLGGMALLHIIVVYGAGNAFSKDINFVEMYTSYARVYQTLFHILAILCFISIMDRCDMKHMDVNHLTDLFYYHFSTILVFLVYFITLILTFVTTKWDDWFALSPKGLSIEQESDIAGNLVVWKCLNLSRNIGAILGWILVAFFPAEDMLYLHLCNMMKYQTAAPVRVVPAKY
ncbi:transmembrane protein 237B [Periplaneta americana]|uniref:transmembrane protein 237B n=1 Tax=Periplaneta americana TaxID=6978 RepID=UPI0037E83C2B